MRAPAPIFALALALAAPAALAIAGCSADGVPADGSAPVGGSAPAQTTDRQGGDDMNEFTSTAMAIAMDDGSLLFIDQDTESPYRPGVSEAEIVDADGNEISAGDLPTGAIVRVTGNGIMLESYPGQYPGISRIEVVDEGSPEDADRYQDLIDELTVVRDPAEPAQASIGYRTELAQVTLALMTHGYTWTHEENGQGVGVCVDVAHPCQVAGEDLPDAALDGPTTATAIFDLPATGLTVTRWSEKDIAAAMGDGTPSDVDPGLVANEDVPVKETDGDFTFAIEPGWRYRLDATFDAGQVGYFFTTS